MTFRDTADLKSDDKPTLGFKKVVQILNSAHVFLGYTHKLMIYVNIHYHNGDYCLLVKFR